MVCIIKHETSCTLRKTKWNTLHKVHITFRISFQNTIHTKWIYHKTMLRIMFSLPLPLTFTLAIDKTRMHSSRMRTARLLPVSPNMQCSQGGCTWSGGVPGLEGTCPGGVPGPWGGVPAWGVYLVPGGCTCMGGVPAWGVCTWSGGVYLPRGSAPGLGGVPARRVPAQVLPPWTEWQTGVKILPCPKLRLRAVNIALNTAWWQCLTQNWTTLPCCIH